MTIIAAASEIYNERVLLIQHLIYNGWLFLYKIKCINAKRNVNIIYVYHYHYYFKSTLIWR